MSDVSENTLIKQASQGDDEAFASLVELYSSRIYSVCFSFLGNRQDAEDCAQEAFIKAYKAISKFNFKASFYTWIYRIAVNSCHDYRRKYQKVVIHSLDQDLETEDSSVSMQIADDNPLPDEIALANETKELIHQEIQALPEYLGQILILRDIEELSYQELADVLNLNLGTVKSRLARARKQLMEQLKEREQNAVKTRQKTDRSARRSERR